MYQRPCARCGSRPRWNDTFLCKKCYLDPQQKKEVAEATASQINDKNSARTYLIKTFHWAGWR